MRMVIYVQYVHNPRAFIEFSKISLENKKKKKKPGPLANRLGTPVFMKEKFRDCYNDAYKIIMNGTYMLYG